MKLNNLALCMAASMALTACGGSSSSDSDPAETPVTGTPTTGTPTTGTPTDENPLYLVKSTAWVTEAGVSLHFITDTLDQNTAFDTEKALSFPEYTGIAIPEGDNPDNAFYVGMKTSAVLQRYVVDADGTPSLDKQMDFSAIAASLGRDLLRATQFMSPTKAYVLDFRGLQVIAFNPTTMTLIDLDPATEVVDTISLAALQENPEGSQWSVFPITDGDRFVATMGVYPKGGADVGVTKLIIVDSKDDSLATDSVENCGAVSGAAKDEAGHMYFASYTEAALQSKLGVPGAYAPCVVRVLKDSNQFDDFYNVSMSGLTNNARMAAGTVTGNGNIGYNLVMSDAGEQLFLAAAGQAQQAEDPAAAVLAAGKQAIALPLWEFHSFDLTDDNAVATKVPGVVSHPNKVLPAGVPDVVGGTIGRITTGTFTHHTLGDITWMSHTDYDQATSLYNATNPEGWTVISHAIPGQLEFVGRLR